MPYEVMRNEAKPSPAGNEPALESWKEIALYLKRDVSTVKRWEKEESLPIRRHLHQSRSSVYAYASELDAWRAARKPVAEPVPSWWLRPMRSIAAAAALMWALFLTGDAGIRPTMASPQNGDVVLRRVWSGNDVDTLGSPSPDGKHLSFVDWSTGDLAIRDLATGQNRRLTQKGTWAKSEEYAEYSVISADGQVAYAWYNNKFYDLRVVRTDGTGQRVLFASADVPYVQPCAWSPDAAYLFAVFSRRDQAKQIVRITLADGTVRVLKNLDWRYPRGLAVSSDGRFLAYDFPPKEDRGERDIFMLTADGSRETPLVQHMANEKALGWAPDGSGVLFSSDRTDPTSIWLQPVQQGIPAGPAHLVRSNIGRIQPMGMDARKTLYYASGGGQDVYIAEMDEVTGSLLSPVNATERLVNVNSGPDWSPDGEYLSFVAGRGSEGAGSNVIVIRSVRTGEEREVRPTGVNVVRNPNRAAPRWSPDGRLLLFLGRDLKGQRGFFTTEVATNKTVPVFHWGTGSFWFPEWSADGKSILYGAEGENETRVVRRDLKTGRETVVFRSKHIHAHARSNDGKWLALAAAPPDDATATGVASQLVIVPPEGGSPRVLRTAPEGREFSALAWSPDGQSVYFMMEKKENQGERESGRIALAGGEAHPVRLEMSPRQLRSLRFHPGRKTVAYDKSESAQVEVWALENLLPIQRASQ